MPVKTMELTIAQMKQVLQDAGAADVSGTAAEELAETLENYIGYISEEAVAQARQQDRTAVRREDIIAAEE